MLCRTLITPYVFVGVVRLAAIFISENFIKKFIDDDVWSLKVWSLRVLRVAVCESHWLRLRLRHILGPVVKPAACGILWIELPQKHADKSDEGYNVVVFTGVLDRATEVTKAGLRCRSHVRMQNFGSVIAAVALG